MVSSEELKPGGLYSRRRNTSGASLEAMDVEVATSGHASKAESSALLAMSMTHLVMLNAIVCGLEFCASAAFCYIPPMLLKADISEQSMSMILGVGPTLGFFLVPVIGRSSDRCRSRYGRRRPFIFGLSILLIFALFIIPYGRAFCRLLFGRTGEWSASMGLVSMVVGAIMLDFTCQTCLTPCEAMLSDLSRGTTQHSRCFTVYSFMVSIGGCVGYLITAVDWAANPLGVQLGGQEPTVFMVLVVLFSFSALLTFGAATEVPLTEDTEQHRDGHIPPSLLILESDGKDDHFSSKKPDNEHNGILGKGVGLPALRVAFGSMASSRRVILGPLTSAIASLYSRLRLSTPFRNLSNVPFVLRRLALANFCSWTAVMGFNLFFSDFVGQAVYGGNPSAEEGSEARILYDRGVRVGSFGLLLHCVNSAMYAGIIERIMARFDLRLTYVVGMATFTLAMSVMVITQNVYVVCIMAAMTGVGYATLTTTPFMLVTNYHEDEQLYFYDTGDGITTPPRGMGMDFATLDSAYYLSQVFLTSFMGYIVHWTGTVRSYVIVAGLVGVISCFCASRLIVSKSQMQLLIKMHHVRSR